MLRSRWSKIAVFLACLAPFGVLAWRFYRATVLFELTLGPNPLETLTHFTGDWTIRFLAATLAITPLRKALGLPDLVRFRRMIGLFAFFYGCLHFGVYLYFDKLFDFHEIAKDVAKRRFIMAGFAAFLFMMPLAVTSTAWWIRRLGGKRWQRLHRLVYASGAAAVIHYYWLVKSDIRLPLLYGAIIGALLLARVAVRKQSRDREGAVAKAAGEAVATAPSRSRL
jgi:sulfoxide reductase heme-binding subunit YedZ